MLLIVKSEPDKNTMILMDYIIKEKKATVINLYEEGTNYDKLLDLVFDHKEIISLW